MHPHRVRTARALAVLLAVALLAPLLPAAVAPTPAGAERDRPRRAEPVPGSYIVVLTEPDAEGAARRAGKGSQRDRRAVAARAGAVAGKHGGKVRQIYSAVIPGFAVEASARDARELLRDPDVAALVPNYPVEGAVQETPRGVKYVGADQNPVARIDGRDGNGERVQVSVAVLDSGIDYLHPDLFVVGGYNCTSDDPLDWQDDHGHGTHVAGTIGAIDNGDGVVGVAPGAALWAIRVLDANNAGSDATVMCGLDWVSRNEGLIDAVNASLGSTGGDRSPVIDGNGLTDPRGCAIYTSGRLILDVYHLGWCVVASKGIPVVVAAGNDGKDAANVVPAAYDEVLTVSNMDFGTSGKKGRTLGKRGLPRLYKGTGPSNFGRDVDIAAPGTNVRSTLTGGGTVILTGTSMAAPHVTGGVALYLATVDPDRNAAGTLGVYAAIDGQARQVRLRHDPDGIDEGILDVRFLGVVT